MLPLCREEKIQGDPVQSSRFGRLTRDWSSRKHASRSETDQIAKTKYDAAMTNQQVVEAVMIADKHGVPRVHVALAWLLQKKPVTAPIIRATKITHLGKCRRRPVRKPGRGRGHIPGRAICATCHPIVSHQ